MPIKMCVYNVQVTWMKPDRDQLLTAGGQVYSSEARYAVSHARHMKVRQNGN